MKVEDKARLMVIGLDGGTYDLLLPLIEAGHMPNLKTFLAGGAWGELESTVPPFTATAWSTFATGVNPGKHGILQFQHFDRYSYGRSPIRFVDAAMLPKTIWEYMGDAGLDVGVLHVPLTYPTRPVRGEMVSGMMTPADAAQAFNPPELKSEFPADYPFDVDFVRTVAGDTFRDGDFPAKTAMLTEIGRVMAAHVASAERMLTTKDPRFFMVVLTATDRLGHFFWDELNEIVHGSANGEIHRQLLALLADLDRDLGGLIALRQAANDYIMVMSDHGFGPAQTRQLNLNIALREAGYLAERESAGWGDLEYWRVKLGQNVLLKRLARMVLPQAAQQGVTAIARRTGNSDMINWPGTQAFLVPIYFHVCGIALNVVGERRDGSIFPGPEYETVRSEIIDLVSQLTDPNSGKRLVDGVHRREALFSGPYLHSFPDIIVELNPDFVPGGTLAGGELVEPYPPFRSGDHRPNGIFAMRGPAIPAAANRAGLALIDLPATILYLLGVPIPSYFDSRVMRDLIDPVLLTERPPTTQSIGLEDVLPAGLDGDNGGDDQAVEDRLRGLGYID